MGAATSCTASLTGWIEGEPWTRWRQADCGQVRFWLRPIHAGAGLLLCAVPVRGARDLRAATEAIVPGRSVELMATPTACDKSEGARDEALCRVVFLAREAAVAGFPLVIRAEPEPAPVLEPLAHPHAPRAVGKAAAAGEHQEEVA